MTRPEARKGFDPEVRMVLLEEDADDFEASVVTITGKIDDLIAIGIKAAVGLGTSAVLIGINLILTYVVQP